MKTTIHPKWFFLPILLILLSCSDDFDVTPERNEFGKLELQISGLADLGNDFIYEGWIIVNNSAISTGVFKVDEDGILSKKSFLVEKEPLTTATTFVLTIEPLPDNDPAPSSTHIIGGSFSANSATLSIGHSSSFNNDFISATGSFILATPTNESTADEKSGIWWLDPNTGPGPGLVLPALTSGWKYEGWAVVNGIPLSTGTFTQVDKADDEVIYGTNMPGPPFPGEDFLFSPPEGLSFPLDLSGATAVISIEPDPDNDPGPFSLKPLIGAIPNPAQDHTLYPMENTILDNIPTGVASR